MNRPKIKISLIIICIAVIVVFVIDFILRVDNAPFDTVDPRRTKGNIKASIQVTEFVDFTCRECVRGYRIIEDYMQEYPNTIYLMVRYFPQIQKNSAISARYAHCASLQNKFWEYQDVLFSKQPTWRTLDLVEPYLTSVSKDVGLDPAFMKTCAHDEKTRKAVYQDRILGESHFVHMTPTYFINGEMIVGVEEMKQRLAELYL